MIGANKVEMKIPTGLNKKLIFVQTKISVAAASKWMMIDKIFDFFNSRIWLPTFFN
ncbi:hypothetical protein CMALT430_380105 [Carnobacterium maltaromaticum]|nr:hypothetical protein CMALT430_380105 [Carnobacterium maltaromaticum]